MCPVLDQIRNLEAVLDHLSEGDRDRIFRQTAERLYRFPPIAAVEAPTRNPGRQAVGAGDPA
jgi:hypothetical protein